MTSRDIADLHPDMRPLCRQFLLLTSQENIPAFLTCTYRSVDDQNKLYAQGRSRAGKIITYAKGGESKHNFTIDGKPASKAFDIAIRGAIGELNWDAQSQPWQRAGAIGRELGLTWGGDFKRIKDYPHFEIP